MRVKFFDNFERLVHFREAWDRLAGGGTFRCWTWLTTWWNYYQRPCDQLMVAGVFDDKKELVAFAPWYTTRSARQGTVLRLLGDGEVASDYVSLPCREGLEQQVAESLAERLADKSWDLIRFDAIEEDDLMMRLLQEQLVARGCRASRRAYTNAWRLSLPTSWDDYLAMLSKGHRKEVRRLVRDYFDTGRVVRRTVTDLSEVDRGILILVDLHQRRRQSLGEKGLFLSTYYASFHLDVIPRLLAEGRLRLDWIELDGTPLAVEYQVLGGDTVFAYQSGLDPKQLDIGPGRLSAIAALRASIDEGRATYDWLRGDEPYKAHFRGEPRPLVNLRMVPDRAIAKLREGLNRAAGSAKAVVKSGMKWAGVRPNRVSK